MGISLFSFFNISRHVIACPFVSLFNENIFTFGKYFFIFFFRDLKELSIKITDDGKGFSRDILDKLGEPYIRSTDKAQISKYGFGLGTFIGKTLLEKNFAKIKFDNLSNKSGAKVTIFWKNSDLNKI